MPEELLLKISRHLKSAILPVALAVLFVIQNQFFNIWLNLYSSAYFTRLSLVTFALGVVLYGPALLFKKKYAYIYLFLVSFLVSCLFCAQFLYFKYSDSFLQFSAIKYMWQADSVMGTVKTLLTPEILLFISNALLVLSVFFFRRKQIKTDFIVSFAEKAIIVVIIIIIVFSGYKYLLDKEKKEWGNTSRLYTDVYDLNALVGKMGIINFSIEDTAKYILRSRLVLESDKTFLQNWVKNRTTPVPDKNYFGLAQGKNLIIIQVESLENAVINKSINGQEITPNLNKLAVEGLYFNNFYSQVGPGNTADAEFSTMNSLYPLPDDVVFVDYAKNTYNALPKILKDNGYGTYCFHGDVPTFWNRSNIYPGLGYEKMFDLSDFTVTRPVGKGPSDLGDEDLFLQSLPRLKSLKQPFLATVITMSSHTPFILPNDLQELQMPADTTLDKNQQNYLQSIHYTDKAIGQFVDGLEKNGLYDNSLIFIWGDHGSFTNISSVFGQNQDLLALAGDHVPMIILGTSLTGVNGIPGSQIDVYPTIANLLGITAPKTVLGQDLLNTKTPVVAHFNLVSGGISSILTPKLAYIASSDGVYSNGKCIQYSDNKQFPIEDCQAIYSQQTDNIKASNIIIRGDLLNILIDK